MTDVTDRRRHTDGTFAPEPAAPVASTVADDARAAATPDELADAIAVWSHLADRHHPQVQPLVRAAYDTPAPAPGPLYRGFVTNVADADGYYPARFECGAVIELVQDSPGHRVVSTSSDPEIAELFTWDDSLDEDDPNMASVFITINDAHGVDLSAHSVFPDQDEWLITGRVRIDQVTVTDEHGFESARYDIEATWLAPDPT